MRPVVWAAPVLSLLWLCTAPAASAAEGTKDAIVLVTIVPKANHPLGMLADRIYREAFSRLGLDFVYLYRPPLRATQEADSGKVDGEIGRGEEYGAQHPNLIRVREPALHLTLSAYALDPSIKLKKWDDFRGRVYRTEYRMGMQIPASRLATRVRRERLSTVSGTLLGLRKLAAGRTDIYVDFDEYVIPLLKSERFVNSERIVKAGTMERVAIHAYLAKKHALLEPKLSEALQQMKKEGVIERYRKELLGRN